VSDASAVVVAAAAAVVGVIVLCDYKLHSYCFCHLPLSFCVHLAVYLVIEKQFKLCLLSNCVAKRYFQVQSPGVKPNREIFVLIMPHLSLVIIIKVLLQIRQHQNLSIFT